MGMSHWVYNYKSCCIITIEISLSTIYLPKYSLFFLYPIAKWGKGINSLGMHSISLHLMVISALLFKRASFFEYSQ